MEGQPLDDRLIAAHHTLYGRQIVALDALASRLNCTKSELVRDGVDLILQRHHPKEPDHGESR